MNSLRHTALLFASILAVGCTAIKPVTCGLIYPTSVIVHDVRTPDEEETECEEYSDLPPVALLAVAPILIPLRFTFLTVSSVVGGAASGFVSDLNLITGNATINSTLNTICLPLKTNAPKRDDS